MLLYQPCPDFRSGIAPSPIYVPRKEHIHWGDMTHDDVMFPVASSREWEIWMQISARNVDGACMLRYNQTDRRPKIDSGFPDSWRNSVRADQMWIASGDWDAARRTPVRPVVPATTPERCPKPAPGWAVKRGYADCTGNDRFMWESVRLPVAVGSVECRAAGDG